MRGLFMPAELEALIGPRFKDQSRTIRDKSNVGEQRGGAVGEESVYASVARLETTAYLTHQLLRDTDVASMAHGLEVRVPFVDAALLRTVWPELGQRPSLLRRKRLLRELITPASLRVIVDKPKRTFTLPMSQWIRGPLADFTRSAIEHLERDGWIAADGGQAIWTQFGAGRAHWSRVWALGVLGHYVSRH
jgi:asparagine synthase (glutamine-hydrolysing)